MPEGTKFDTDKPRYDLIPPELLEGVARVLTFGANKYGAHSWEQGIQYGRVFAAAQRHLWAFWRGRPSTLKPTYRTFGMQHVV